jgi:hypothetical protein
MWNKKVLINLHPGNPMNNADICALIEKPIPTPSCFYRQWQTDFDHVTGRILP